jgi:UDP-glucose 4-epimerase
MPILVTGGAGFIGSHVTHALLERGNEVVVLDPLDPYYDTGIKERNLELAREIAPDAFEYVDGSVTDRTLVDGLFAEYGFDYVYHEAAQAGVRASVEDPLKPHEINTTGFLHVLQAADEYGTERVINASSSSVYGRPDYLPYDEEHRNYPKSPYAVTKLAAEHYGKVWTDVFDLPVVNLRYFTVYGPRMRPNMAISNFVSRCLNGDPPVIYGDGEQTRDFTYADDVVQANLALLETDAADGEDVNVGSTDNITINDLAEHVIDVTGADVEIVYEAAKEADARHTHSDVSKARELLDYEPTTDIREGVERFVEWYEANREWYEPLVLNS